MARGLGKKKAKPVDLRVGPTQQQRDRCDYASAGMAHRRVPVIETMLTRGQLSDSEFRRLSHYRDQALLATRSEVKSCLDDSRSGGGSGLSAAVVSAILVTSRIERELGSLRDIARAVAVDDRSLSQWCIGKHGGRERYAPDGSFVAVVPLAEKRVMDLARMELRMAAQRIAV